jgi:hypothetical protein
MGHMRHASFNPKIKEPHKGHTPVFLINKSLRQMIQIRTI